MRKIMLVLLTFVLMSCHGSMIGASRYTVMGKYGPPIESTEVDGYLVETYAEARSMGYNMPLSQTPVKETRSYKQPPPPSVTLSKTKYRIHKVWFKDGKVMKIQRVD